MIPAFVPQLSLTAAVKALFANGEVGAWYDPSDLTTLFQDSAGTTPVTAVEQPVGLMRDKSGRNNHAFQSTSAARPVLSARVNLLTKTNLLSQSPWASGGVGVVTATDGTDTTLGTITRTGTSTSEGTRYQRITTVSGVSYKYTLRVGQNSLSSAFFSYFDGTNFKTYTIDLSTGAISIGGGSGTVVSVNAAPVSSGVWDVSLVFTSTASNSTQANIGVGIPAALTGSIYAGFVDLRVSNDGVGLPAYQRVNTSTDYDTTEFPLYIKPNGSTQFMVTNSINFTATDKMTIWAGVRKLSDVSAALILELSPIVDSNNGSFSIFAANKYSGNSNTYLFQLRGTATIGVESRLYVSPTTDVLTSVMDIAQASATTELTSRVDATVPANTYGGSASAGTGNFGTYPLYLFMRNGVGQPFGGRFYGMIVRGAASSAGQIANGETYMNSKTKAY